MVPRPHHSTGVGRPYDVTAVMTGLGPDAGHWLGVRPSLLVGEVVDNLTGGGVHHLDAAVQEAHTDLEIMISKLLKYQSILSIYCVHSRPFHPRCTSN